MKVLSLNVDCFIKFINAKLIIMSADTEMNRKRSISHFCLILFMLATCSISQVQGQTNKQVHNSEQTKAYCQAISEYIKAVYVAGVSRPDTLFVGKNTDMPDIRLPNVIEGINTVLLTSEIAKRKLTYRKSLVYLNVVGWIEPRKSEFLIVRFNEFKPQHNCTIHFKRNAQTKEMELEKLTFQYPYDKK